MINNDEDTLLLHQIQQNLEEFAILYRRYLPRVYRYLYFKTGNPDDAEELTSQVFLAALEAMPGYDHRGMFSTWLFSIARRKAADHYRRQYTHSRFIESSITSDPEDDQLTLAIAHENLARLNELLLTLNDEEQEILRLRFAARLQLAEIAALLKRNPSSLKMAYYRLLARLKNKLEA